MNKENFFNDFFLSLLFKIAWELGTLDGAPCMRIHTCLYVFRRWVETEALGGKPTLETWTKIQNWTQEPGALRCFALHHQNQANTILLTSQGAGDTHGITVLEEKLYKRLCYKFEPHVVVCCPKGSGFWQQDPVPTTFKNDGFLFVFFFSWK